MPNTSRRKALVLGFDNRSFLTVIRSLGRGSVEVHAAWNDLNGAASASRYLHKSHFLPHYTEGADKWLEPFIALLQRENFALIIPTNDQTSLALAEHREKLESLAKIYLPDPQSLKILFSKFETTSLARSLGIATPRERIVSSMEEWEQMREEFSLPFILKPRSSFENDSLAVQHFVRKVDDRESGEHALREMLATAPVSVQQYYPGVGIGVELLTCDGEALLEFQHQRVHEPLSGGGSSYRKSTAIDPDLSVAARRLMLAIKHTGVAMVEFKYDLATREWVLLEVNARFWGSLPLAVAAGADFPLALFQLLVEGRRDFPTDHHLELHCRNWTADFGWYLENLKLVKARSDKAISPIALAWEFFRNLVLLRERSDTLVWDDPRPGIIEVRQLVRDIFERVGTKARKRHFASFGTKAEVRRLRTELESAHEVLFVCKGNVCRSPFAEYYAQLALGDRYHFESAGYLPKSGRPTPAEGIEAATKWGVDLQPHRSKMLDASMLAAYEVIFVFDYEIYQRLKADYPECARRLFRLGALSSMPDVTISDPWSREQAYFEEIYARIAASVEQLSKWSVTATAAKA